MCSPSPRSGRRTHGSGEPQGSWWASASGLPTRWAARSPDDSKVTPWESSLSIGYHSNRRCPRTPGCRSRRPRTTAAPPPPSRATSPTPAAPRLRGQDQMQGCKRPYGSGAPPHRVVGLECPPDRHVRRCCDTCRLHDRTNIRLRFVEEGLEAVRIGPFINGHELTVLAIPAMSDKPMVLGDVHDSTDRLRLRRYLLLECRRIAAHTHGHDH